jgi:pilus assembly protein CpaD
MMKKILSTALIATALSGCGTIGQKIGATGNNTSLYSVNQPVIERANYAMDVNVSSFDGMGADQQARVSDWFDALKLGFGDRIAIDYGDGFENGVLKQEVVDLAALHGMVLADAAPVTEGVIAPGTARIVVTRSKATVPNCPNWTKTTEANYNSSNHPNYGCAINGNLAAMVADPEDLVRGRDSNPRNKRGGSSNIGGN